MVLDIIKNRWSPVSFSPKPVEEEKLMAILEAAAHAPSSMNEQPWLFILVTRDESKVFNSIINMLADSNQVWAGNAYALMISLARMNHQYKERPNKYAFHDTGMAVANMLTQATSVGVYFHQMGGFSVEKVKQYFSLTSDIEPVAVMAVGYQGDGKELPEELSNRDKSRKPRKKVTEYAFRNKFNNPVFFRTLK